jgi:hypothetical protein
MYLECVRRMRITVIVIMQYLILTTWYVHLQSNTTEICTFLRCYAAYDGNFLLAFWDR